MKKDLSDFRGVVIGAKVAVRSSDGNSWQPCEVVSVAASNRIVVAHVDGSSLITRYAGSSSGGDGNVFLITEDSNLSVEGNVDNGFTVTDVIGDPANILTTPDLANGWMGYWGGANKGTGDYLLSRKLLSTLSGTANMSGVFSDDLGVTWTSFTSVPVDIANNAVEHGMPANRIVIDYYTAAPYQTEQDVNRPVLHALEGVKEVMVNSRGNSLTESVLLCESLINKVCKDIHGANTNQSSSVVNARLNSSDNTLVNGYMLHNPILPFGVNPANDSPAVKSLAYQTEENKGLYLNFAYNELKHDGTDWGDDSTVKITDGQSTYINLNGETCLYGTNRLTKRYGWKK